MELRVDAATAAEAAAVAADLIGAHARQAAETRGRFHLGLSGGRGPEPLFAALTRRDLPWPQVEVWQVDERVAPAGHEDRNLELIRRSLSPVLDRLGRLHPMPVEDDDLEAAAGRYEQVLVEATGRPPVLDLVQLGVGPDGHTASLVPGEPVLAEVGRAVATTGAYQGRRRMTLTFPVLDAARHRLWFVTDPSKGEAVARLLARDPSVPAGRVRAEGATLVATAAVAAAAGIGGRADQT